MKLQQMVETLIVKLTLGIVFYILPVRMDILNVVKELARRGANVDIQTNIGTSSLHSPSQNGHSEVVNELLCNYK